MELARVMSQYRFEKTIVFIAFGGEEIGLVGSSLYAAKAKEQKAKIEAVLNNDVVGVAVAGDGRTENALVHVFSDEPADSPSRELARYIRETAQRCLPGFRADPSSVRIASLAAEITARLTPPDSPRCVSRRPRRTSVFSILRTTRSIKVLRTTPPSSPA
jgi:Zn-dependent M28 family amino/carboxypeptidase